MRQQVCRSTPRHQSKASKHLSQRTGFEATLFKQKEPTPCSPSRHAPHSSAACKRLFAIFSFKRALTVYCTSQAWFRSNPHNSAARSPQPQRLPATGTPYTPRRHTHTHIRHRAKGCFTPHPAAQHTFEPPSPTRPTPHSTHPLIVHHTTPYTHKRPPPPWLLLRLPGRHSPIWRCSCKPLPPTQPSRSPWRLQPLQQQQHHLQLQRMPS